MAIRTTRSTVTFRSAFRLAGMAEQRPAGTYDVETDEEIIETNGPTIYRRIATLLIVKEAGCLQTLSVDPLDLEAALKADKGDGRAARL